MNMKRTIALVLTIAICATMALGGTLAFLTDTEKAVNIMTVGNIEIEMYEQEREGRDEDGNMILGNFTQNQSLVPAVMPEDVTKEPVVVNGYEVQIRDNVANYVDKIVSVKNTGIVDAYVRTIIAFPSTPNEFNDKAYDNWLHWNAVSNTDTEPNNGWMWGTAENGMEWPGNNPGWNRIDDVMIDGKEYDLVIATNVNRIKPGEATAPTLLGFYLDERVDAERLPDGSLNHYIMLDGVKNDLGDLTNMKIYVATQAVQADGFDDAWTALDKAFPLSQDNHPWMNEPEYVPGRASVDWYYQNTEKDEFHLRSLEDLAGLTNLVNEDGVNFAGKTIYLETDVDMNMGLWRPIGDKDHAFSGTFDGQGHTISNLYVPGYEYAGLFGKIYPSATVKNVNVENAIIEGPHYAGTIVGYAYGNILDCSANKVTITCVDPSGENGDKAGGIVGYVGEGNYRLENCMVGNLTITANRDAGHIAGCVQPGVQISGEGSFGRMEMKWSGYGSGDYITDDTVGRDLR